MGHRARLRAERRKAEARLAALTRDFDRVVQAAALDPPDDEHDPEGATIAFERQQLATLIGQTTSALAELHEAEARLAAGTYGVCEGCGQSLPDERLEARPTARTCIACVRHPGH
jgi:DnaK suppressor protein